MQPSKHNENYQTLLVMFYLLEEEESSGNKATGSW